MITTYTNLPKGLWVASTELNNVLLQDGVLLTKEQLNLQRMKQEKS